MKLRTQHRRENDQEKRVLGAADTDLSPVCLAWAVGEDNSMRRGTKPTRKDSHSTLSETLASTCKARSRDLQESHYGPCSNLALGTHHLCTFDGLVHLSEQPIQLRKTP